MLRHLFGGLTERRGRGQAVFERAVEEARRPHWYLEGEVPDSIDGRFAVLATACALVIVRLESCEAGYGASAALTERFIESMDAEHRELGLSDPGLGRRVRKLVAALERRVDEWRDAIHGETGWSETVVSSLYRGEEPRQAALEHGSKAARDLWTTLSRASLDTVAEGRF